MIVAVLGKLLDQKWLLAIDRTNWQRRDDDVNLLVLAVCLGDLAIPLFWVDLQHKGNSDCQQRTELVQRFLDTFGADRIRAITGDREFVGKDWFKWLKDREIPFVLRIRNNFQVSTTCGRATDVWNCFRNLKMNERKVLGVRKVVGLQLCVSGIRLGGNEYVILVSDGVSGAASFGLYRERWRIETLFQKLKGHGFDLERSRLRGAGKSELLLSILALGTAWRYALGRWHVVAVKSLRLKCDGLFCRSLFRVGLDLLRQVLHGCASCFRRLCRQAIRLICAIPSVRILDSP